MESPTLLQILVIALLMGYGGGLTLAFAVVASSGRGHGSGPVIVGSYERDPVAGCGWGCLGLLGLGGLGVFAVLIPLAGLLGG